MLTTLPTARAALSRCTTPLDGKSTQDIAALLALPEPTSKRTANLLGRALREAGYVLFRTSRAGQRSLEWHKTPPTDAPTEPVPA